MKQFFTLQYWKGQRLLLLAFLLMHIAIASIHISKQDVIVDEPDYYTYAARWLKGNVERTDKMYDSKTPIVAIALIPRIIKQVVHPGYKATDFGRGDVLSGRYLMVFYTIIIALYLFVWIRQLFGAKAWILPLLFFLFDPMVLGFSMITTSDMASGACLLATMYHLYQFYLTGKKKAFLLFSLWVGVSFVCKASLLFLLPCFLGLYIILLSWRVISFDLKKLIVYSLVLFCISLSVINLAYFGKDSFRTMNQVKFESKAFSRLADIPLINDIPLPLPENYVVALDLLQYHKEIGAGKLESSYPGVFLNGRTKYVGGFWYYYLYVGFYKIPIAILFLLAAGVLTLLTSFKRTDFWKKHTWYLWPAIFFFIILSCLNTFQLGLRHLLLIYPLFFIAIAAVLHYWRKRFKYTIQVTWLLFLLMLISESIYFPNLIAYTNEFITDKKNVFRKIKDASIDYGQSAKDRQLYLEQHPGVVVPGKTPKPGKYIVLMMELFDEGPESTNPKYLWLLDFEPVAHYKYDMFIFDISGHDIQNLQQKNRP